MKDPTPQHTRALVSGPGSTPDQRTAAVSLEGKVLDNRYRVLSRLGEGGIGAVYAAEHVRLRRRVAVKVLHPELSQNEEFRARFEREALAASKATHPSCVAVLDVGSVDGQPYLVMEYVEGERLGQHIARGELTPAGAVEIGLQLLEALRHAHQLGIVHRDIKPDNVMLCQQDRAGTRVKLLDFGLAKNLIPGAPGSQTVTQYGTVFGTPSYMSPEQAAAAETDMRSDLYSLGVVLFQMACGRKPFDHDDPMDQIQAHLRQPPPRARDVRPEVSPQLEQVIARALEKEPHRRFQSADEFILALKGVPEAGGDAPAPAPAVSGVGTAATVFSPAAPITRAYATPVRHIPTPLLVGALVVEGLLGLLVFWWLYPDPYSVPKLAERAAASKAAPVSPGSDRTDSPPLTPAPRLPAPELRQAMAALSAGQLERAENLARKAAFRHKDGRANLLLGHIYYNKIWLSDAIKEYRKALRRAPQLRGDETMIANVIGCMRRPRIAGHAIRFLVQHVGPAARPALEQASKSHANSEVRRQAVRALQRLGQD